MNTDHDARYCPRCQADNGCAIANGQPPASCWCMTQPRQALPAEPSGRCYCRQCLPHKEPASC